METLSPQSDTKKFVIFGAVAFAILVAVFFLGAFALRPSAVPEEIAPVQATQSVTEKLEEQAALARQQEAAEEQQDAAQDAAAPATNDDMPVWQRALQPDVVAAPAGAGAEQQSLQSQQAAELQRTQAERELEFQKLSPQEQEMELLRQERDLQEQRAAYTQQQRDAVPSVLPENPPTPVSLGTY